MSSPADRSLKSVVESRRSVREYDRRPVTDEELESILESISHCPNAGNYHLYHVTIVKNAKLKTEVAELSWGQSWVATAPVVLVFSADLKRGEKAYGQRGRDRYCISDAHIACTYAVLSAESLGLKSCWVGAFDEDRLRSVLGLPSQLLPIAVLPIGHGPESKYVHRHSYDIHDLTKVLK